MPSCLSIRRVKLGGVMTALAVASACGGDSVIRSDADLVLVGAQVWDGTGAPLSNPAVIHIADGRVLSVDVIPEGVDAMAEAASAGVEAVAASGQFVVPGFINTHGHVAGTWSAESGTEYTDYAVAELERYARFGVTTVNSLGGDGEQTLALRDASWAGAGLGRARLLVAGAVVTGDTPEAANAVVDANHALGVDWMKIRVDDNLGATVKMPPEVYGAVIDRTHEHGLKLAAHLFYQEDAKGLLRAGADLVAHSVRDQEVDPELMRLFNETGVCYVPTLTREVSTYVYGDRPDFFDDPFLMDDVDEAQVVAVSDPDRQEGIRNSRASQAYRVALEIAQHNLKRLSENDVTIAFGTDTGPLGRFQGFFEHLEMDLMAAAGLSPAEILMSATGDAASCIFRDDIGTLEAGRWADMVVLRANPLDDIRNVRQIESVWVSGVRVPDSTK